ncbi:hypothetical protein V5O48_006100 [Marasmius crinis-equi]|uniref:Uncharacterized protein n=1 Tax=Marasmius crinis-equi TaxID=585013 RepID=A0ABR3FLB4_9AGAR
MSRREAQALYEVDIPEEDFDEYERTEGEANAKADWKRLVEECATEIRANRKHLSSTKKYNCLEDEYYLSRYHTIESQVKRELGGNPSECFVNLYRELILWHDAERPSLSPIEHTVSIFETLDVSVSSLLNWIALRKAKFPIPEERTRQFGKLQQLTQFLTECANELMDAVEAEDGMTSLKHDYKSGSLKFMDRELGERFTSKDLIGSKYSKIFLSRRIDSPSWLPLTTPMEDGTNSTTIPEHLSAKVGTNYTLRDVPKLQMRHPLFLAPRKHGWIKNDEGIWVERRAEEEAKAGNQRGPEMPQWSRTDGGRLRRNPKRKLSPT